MYWTAEQIRERRHARGFRSQRALAEALGVSQRAVAKWETGIGEPSMESIRKLDEVLGPINPPPADLPTGSVPLSEATDTQLLAEIAQRFARSSQSDLPAYLKQPLTWRTERFEEAESPETGEDRPNDDTHTG